MSKDEDPTGISRLLAGLRETGPMPEDLVQRIRTSLDEEQVAREDSEGDDGFWEAGDESLPEDEVPDRRGMGRMVLLGAAGLVGVAAVGSLLVGVLGGEDEAGTSADSSPQPSVTTTASTSNTEDVPAFVITRSGTDYTEGDFGEQAAPLLKGPSGLSGTPGEDLVGTMDTAAGARDCLSRLGSPELVPVALDIATFDGKRGVAIVAELPPDGEVKAFAVTTGCEPIWSPPSEVSTD